MAPLTEAAMVINVIQNESIGCPNSGALGLENGFTRIHGFGNEEHQGDFPALFFLFLLSGR